MTETAPLFDVIVFGSDLAGPERDTLRDHLAGLLSIRPEQAEVCLASKGMVVRRGVDMADARRLHEAMAEVGVRSSWRPARAGGSARLELVPIEEKKEEELLHTCPACGYEHAYAANHPKPEVCEQCGLVFEKYERVTAKRAERDNIRRRLSERQRRFMEEEAAKQRQLEEQLRLEQLEQEVARELNLSRFRLSLPQLSGRILFGAGLAIGAAGMYALNHAGTARALAEREAQIEQTHLSRERINRQDPAAMAHLDATSSAPARSAAAPPKHAPESRRDPVAALRLMRDDLGRDQEWRRFVDARIQKLALAGSYRDAIAVMERIPDLRERYAAGARLVESLRAAGRSQEAQDLLDWLELAVEREAGGGPARVAALAQIAARQPKPAATLARAAAAGNLHVPAERAAGFGLLGAARMQAGEVEAARAAYAEAAQAVRGIADPAARGAALVDLARHLARGGNRAGAALLLEDAGTLAASLADPVRRQSLRLAIASAYGESGDVQSLFDAAGASPVPAEREQMIYRFANRQLAAGRIGVALDAAESLEDPALRARALGLAGQVRGGSEAQREYAALAWKQAAAAARNVAGPAERAAVFSELGRYAGRDDGRAGDAYFAEADRQLKAIGDRGERDAALAVVAGNEARALRFRSALERTAEIGSGELSQTTRDDIENVRSEANAVMQ